MPISPRRVGAFAISAAAFGIVSVLAGVLIAALVIPAAGLAGVTSKVAADELTNLPTELATPTPATRSRVLMANGKILAYFYDENRIPVRLSKVAPVMRQAQLAIEDHRFYEHGALDLKGTLRALLRNTASDGVTQGGSSLTQQYVKMVQIEACEAKDDATCVKAVQAPTVQRKIRELRYAVALEKRLSKDQILERYLNIAYYGQGAYGVESAAKHYFSTTAAKLTLPQAAMLAGLVQSPDANNPVNNPSAALTRRDQVLSRMAELDLITPTQAAQAKKTGFDKRLVSPTRNGCVGSRYPFLCDYVRRTLLNTPSLGKTVQERQNMLNRGGLTIQTAIDPKVQDLAQKKVSAVIGARDPLISTMNMIQPGTGLIVAMVQSRPVMGSITKKGETYWNLAVDPAMGGIQGYQAGSTFKAFTAAAALEKGIPLQKKYDAKRTIDYSGRHFQSCKGDARVYGKWRVSNSTGANGVMNMYRGIAMSVNNYFVQLELNTGMCRVTKMAQRLGVKLGTRDRNLVDYYQDKPSFTLGSVEVSPLSMAEAYATFAARGVHCSPIIVSKITARDGRQLKPLSANCQRVISKEVADGVNSLLQGVMRNGTGTRARVPDGRPQAGKTGTIDSNEAVWFAGYTPEIAGVAMISIDVRKKPFIRHKAGFRHGGVKYFRVPSSHFVLEGSGSGDAGMKIWKPTMTQYFKKLPRTGFKQPTGRIQHGKIVTVPYIGGLSISAASRKLEKAGFSVVREYHYSNSVPAGSFIGWSPGSGARIGQFGTISAVFSRGRDPAVVAAEKAKKKAEAKKKADAAKKKAEEAKKKADAAKKKKPGG